MHKGAHHADITQDIISLQHHAVNKCMHCTAAYILCTVGLRSWGSAPPKEMRLPNDARDGYQTIFTEVQTSGKRQTVALKSRNIA